MLTLYDIDNEFENGFSYKYYLMSRLHKTNSCDNDTGSFVHLLFDSEFECFLVDFFFFLQKLPIR